MIKTNLSFIFGIIFLFLNSPVFAQDGQVDPNFNSVDAGTQEINQFTSGYTKDAIVYTDGSMVIVGDFKFFNGIQRNGIVKLNTDLSISQNFNTGTGADSTIFGIRLLQNGKIFLFGKFTYFNGVFTNGTILLSQDGSVDPSYQTNQNDWDIALGEVSDAIEQNGKLLLSGGISNIIPGTAASKLQRILLNGNRDFSLPDLGNFNSKIYDLVLGNSDTIYIGGEFTEINGSPFYGIIKLTPNGLIDTNFQVALSSVNNPLNPSIITSFVQKIDLDQNNQIVLNIHLFGVRRLLYNGNLDTSFNATSHGNLGIIKHQLDKYLIYSNLQSSIKLVSQLNTDGSKDESFKNFTFTGILDQSIQQVIIRSDLKIIVLGGSSIYMLNQNGTRDASFNPINGVRGKVTAVKTLDDGKTLIGGSFYGYNEHSIQNIARLTSTGELDVLFNPNIGAYNSVFTEVEIKKIDVQNDGKIIVIGNFINFNGVQVNKIIRLEPNGNLDSTFNPDYGLGYFSSQINDFLILPDGKLLLCSNQGIRRFNSNGSFDPTFYYPNLISGTINKLLALDDGKFLAGGTFSTYDGSNRKNIVRLNPDGTVDQSFSSGSGTHTGGVLDMGIQSNGKYIISGTYTNYNGNSVNKVFRIETNGNFDPTFNTTSFFTNTAVSMIGLGKLIVLPNNKIIVNHLFQNENIQRICRLTSDGAVDSEFDISPNGNIFAFDLQSNWGIIAAGIFASYANIPKNGIVRIFQDETPQACWDFTGDFIEIENINCTLGNSSIIYKAQNGQAPFLYSWNNGSWIENDTLFHTTLAGIQSVSVKDANGCYYSSNFMVHGPTSPTQTDLTGNLITDNFRTGFSSSVVIDARNLACQTSNAQIKLIFDTLLSVSSVTPTPDLISGDTLIWYNFFDTYNSNAFISTIQFLTSTNAQIGDSIHLILSVSSDLVDHDLTNNQKSYTFPVLNGYDPNDKKVYPIGECTPGYIENDQKLTYTVRFQNTGNSEAINIAVIDTISPFLNLNTLEIIASSHEMEFELLSNRAVKFLFENINLPDSTSNENGSKGYVIYSIDVNPNLLVNTVIKNKAEIYFDFNPEIITNTVTNTIKNGNSHVITNFFNVTALDSFTWNNITYSSSGLYSQNFNAANSCDSIVFLNLEVIASNNTSSCSNFKVDSVIYQNISCSSPSTLTISTIGGTQPYFYSWNQGLPTYNDSTFITNTPGIINVKIFDNLGCNLSKNYLVNAPTETDQSELEINIVSTTSEPTNQNQTLILIAKNNSCQQANGTLSFVLDQNVSFISASTNPDEISGDTLKWNLTNLSYDANTFSSLINFSLNSSENDTYFFSSSIQSSTIDSDSLNNSKNYRFRNFSSNPPLTKNIYPQGNCEVGYFSDNYLTYGISVKNYLTSDFENSTIIDTISEKLSIDQLKWIYSSKRVCTEIEYPNVVKFVFGEKINPNEIDYLVYQIKTIDAIQENDEIENRTIFSSYQVILESNQLINTFTTQIPVSETDTIQQTSINEFNWNDEILTESGFYTNYYTNIYGCDSIVTLDLTIESNVGVSSMYNNFIQIFPNPSTGTFTITGIDNNNSVAVYSTSGECVFFSMITNNQIDLSHLNSGMYFIQIQNTFSTHNEKIIIRKNE